MIDDLTKQIRTIHPIKKLAVAMVVLMTGLMVLTALPIASALPSTAAMAPGAASPATVDLGSAGNFAILAKSGSPPREPRPLSAASE